MKNGR